ncbi:MAG: ABC transporter ATP-binding protein [Candidatus Thermoplasmatota archaeon]|nr:ABC transporter ATP-binding protein [Candidatus Thermoplasmatota archaeon]
MTGTIKGPKWDPPTGLGPAVNIRGAVKSWEGVHALKGVDLEVRRGEIFGLIGPNGAGKSTLMRSLLGMVKLDEGSVRILGLNPRTEELRIKAYTGFVPESESPPSFLTLNEFLEFVLHVRGMEPSKEKKDRWTRFFDLEGSGNTIARNMSKGTRQKLMLSSAFIHEPPLLLLDEPFINLDPIYQRKVKDHLLEYVKDRGTILISTHILALAEELCDRVAIINKGKILKTGRTRDILKDHDSLEEAFLNLIGYYSEI